MRPYPPLGILYLSSHLKARGFDVGVFDGTFQSLVDFGDVLAAMRPPIVGVSVNMMTKRHALRMMALARDAGAWVVVGGPDPPYYAAEYLAAGADVVVVGEGEADARRAASGPADVADLGADQLAGDRRHRLSQRRWRPGADARRTAAARRSRRTTASRSAARSISIATRDAGANITDSDRSR